MLIAAAIVVLALGVSACGGGKKSSSTTTGVSATEQWAGGVCTAFTTWKNSLEGIKSNLKSGGVSSLSSSELNKAASQVEAATQTLVTSLKNLGKPETANAQTAKTNLTSLQKSLSEGMTTIENALKSAPSSVTGAMTALSTVTTELGKMKTDLTQGVNNLKQIDPGSDLEQAFKQAPSCAVYVSS